MSVAGIAGGVAAAAGAAGGIMSADASNSATAANLRAQQQQQAFDMLMNAIAMRKSEEGTHTPYYSTVYIPGIGWQTQLTGEGSQLFTASNQVQRGQMADQLGQLEEQKVARQRRQQQGAVADVLLKRFMQGNGMLPDDYAALMRSGATSSTKRAMDDTERNAGLTLLRQGADPTAFMRAISGERANAYSDASAGVPLNARLQFESSRDNFNNNAGSLYGQFANSASSISGAPFTPFNVASTENAVSNAAQNGTNAVALAKSGNTIPQQSQPMQNSWNSFGSALGGLGLMADSGSFDSLGKLLSSRQNTTWDKAPAYPEAKRTAKAKTVEEIF